MPEETPDPEPPSRRTRFRLVIDRDLLSGRVPRRLLERAIARVAKGERASGELRLIVVDNRRMHQLNRQFRHKDKATDVLSFPAGDPFPGERGNGQLGEVYCNYDHAVRWSREVGGTVADELVRLAVHGTLHLLGYDHHTAAERDAMADREDGYLSGSGLIVSRGAGVGNAH